MTTKRAGFTTSEKGDQAFLRWLPGKFDGPEYGPDTWIAKPRGVRGGLVGIAQRLHAQNEQARAASRTREGHPALAG